MGDFELNLFLNFGGHLFAPTVRRFCSYIKQTSRENGGQRTDQPSVQLVLMLLLMLVIVIEINLATNTQRPTPNIQHPIEESRGQGQTFATRLGEYHAKAVRFRRLRT